MFDIGFWELVLISMVGLVVLGPERLPTAIRSVSRFIRSAKEMANNVKGELSHELKIQELQANLRKTEEMGMEELSPELNRSVGGLVLTVQDTIPPYSSDKIKAVNSEQSTRPAVSSEVPKPVENELLDKVLNKD
ncbi:Sec-independent protein translocase protein TatB [Vibrio maritimus]|uniref:Sec-independent protein translocase protein TatB n=1 Tax=Vibrio maritimus TaxID=990268 RepID=UPI001F492DE1|nr:Sec-independent protein translocase protein TatB [Vibrio maritimus]